MDENKPENSNHLITINNNKCNNQLCEKCVNLKISQELNNSNVFLHTSQPITGLMILRIMNKK